MFSSKSRYTSLEIAKWTTPEGRILPYVRRRFLPPLVEEPFIEHEVTDSDRLDNVTAQYLGDPEQYWRICDVNTAMHPAQLLDSDRRRIRILPERGI
jgi:hypothetical protein